MQSPKKPSGKVRRNFIELYRADEREKKRPCQSAAPNKSKKQSSEERREKNNDILEVGILWGYLAN